MVAGPPQGGRTGSGLQADSSTLLRSSAPLRAVARNDRVQPSSDQETFLTISGSPGGPRRRSGGAAHPVGGLRGGARDRRLGGRSGDRPRGRDRVLRLGRTHENLARRRMVNSILGGRGRGPRPSPRPASRRKRGIRSRFLRRSSRGWSRTVSTPTCISEQISRTSGRRGSRCRGGIGPSSSSPTSRAPRPGPVQRGQLPRRRVHERDAD